MWNKLKNWQRALIILVGSSMLLYILGRLLVPIGYMGRSVADYEWPPLLYAVFLLLPILVIKYSTQRSSKVIAGIILGIFLLSILVASILGWSEFYGDALDASENRTLIAAFSFIYGLPLMGILGLFTILMILTGSGWN